MNEIIFNGNLAKQELLASRICVEDEAMIEDGAILEHDVVIKGKSRIKSGARVGSFTIISNSIIGERCVVLSSQIEDSTIGDGSQIGPYAHIRMNSLIGENNRVGNFVEIKNSSTGRDCKMAHLTYVGDAELGNNCNIGCGVVFCNYNGKTKQKCEVGNNAFIGSNVNLIAPVKVGDNAYIAAGSTITQDVKEREFAIARARQINKQNFENPYID